MAERKSRLNPVVGAARQAVAAGLNEAFGAGTTAPTGSKAQEADATTPLVLVAVSGGPDSMALAALTAHFARRGDIRAGAVIVDHNLQEGSAEVAQRTAAALTGMGLAPVLVESVTVDFTGQGPEKAARIARYGAYERAVATTGATAVLLGHTLDDQAETVLLGLARGSGTRSLAGMPLDRTENGVRYIRPMLTLRRTQIEEVCAAEGITPWQDPTNTDQTFMRSRVRHSILPYLEENLGGDVATSLARTAAIVGPDADYLDAAARTAYTQAVIAPADLTGAPTAVGHSLHQLLDLPAGTQPLLLDRNVLTELHPALRNRVLALAIKNTGGQAPGYERLAALEAFVKEHSVAGPLQLAGHVSAYRRRPSVTLTGHKKQINLKKTGLIVLLNTTA